MAHQPTPLEKFLEHLTAAVGSIPSLFLHTCAFAGSFLLVYLGYASLDRVLLVVTTIVSLEAIYLSIFIQMTVNRQARALTEVSADVEEISEDVEDIQEDVEEISKDVEEISEDMEEIHEDVEEIQEDVEEMSDDWDLAGGKGVETAEQLRNQLRDILAKLEAMNEKP